MRPTLKICIALAIPLLLGAPAWAQPVLADYFGSWQSSGQLMTQFGHPMRPGRCRVEALAGESARELRIEGACAAAAGRSQFILRLIWHPDGRIQAGFRAQGMEETAQFIGSQTGDRVELTSISGLFQGEQEFTSNLVLDFQSAAQFTVQEWIAPVGSEGRQQSLNMVFARRDG